MHRCCATRPYMPAHTRTAALIVAAGTGSRSGSAIPKQFVRVAGRSMLAWSHEAFSDHPRIDDVVVVIGDGQQQDLAAALGDVPFVIGGERRQDSVRAGLEWLDASTPERVLIHDAARPFVLASTIDVLLEALDEYEGAVPALPVTDTLVRSADHGSANISREGLLRVQTPQAFAFTTILDAHRAWPTDRDATDDAQMVRDIGRAVTIVTGDPMLEKVTSPADFAAAEARIGFETRSATGFDVHRLADGEEIWLGGVRIPHSQGLTGHSDADVALHAITDAVLGTIGAGDIGMHFPPSDSRWKGAPSDQFLRHAVSLVEERGGRISFVDLTLICESPKIGPHRDAIRRRIAELLCLSPDRVSVKATTTEGLGFTGRGEGIAAQAIATVRLPGGHD